MRANLNMEKTEHSENGFSQQCNSCDAPSFSGWCLDCHEALCEDCVSAHRRVSVTRSHRLLNHPPAGPRTTTCQRVIGDPSTPPTKFCRLHPSEPLKLFCLTCNQLTCRDCQLMTHMNHRYEFVGEALDSLKKQLEDQVQPIRAQRETLRQTLQDMETRLQDIVQYECSLKFELQQSFSLLQQHLTKRMEDVMKNIQIECELKDLPDQDVSPPETMPQMKVVTERSSVEALLNFGHLDIAWIPFSVSRTSSHNKETSGTTTTSAITISPPISTCNIQSATTNDPNSPFPSNSLAVLLKSLSCNLFPATSSTSESSSASCSSSSTCLLPSSRAHLQTVSISNDCSPLPVNQSSMPSKSLSGQLHCSSSSSCSSSTVPAPLSSNCPTPSCSSLVSNRNTSNCISGVPVNFHSTSGQLSLPPSSSSITNSSIAPPTFTPTHRNQITNDIFGNKHPTSLHDQLVCPPFTSFSSSSTVTPPTFTYPAPTCKPLIQRTAKDTRSLVPSRKSSVHQVYPPSSSSLCSTSSSSSSSSSPFLWAPTCTARVPTQLSPAVSSCENISQSRSSPVTSTQHIQPMVSSTMMTNSNQVQIKCVQPVKLQPFQSNFPLSAGSSVSCTVLKPAPQSIVLQRPPAPHPNQSLQNQSPVVLLTDSKTVYQLSCWPVSLPSPGPLLPMLTYSLPEKTCSKQQKQCSPLGNTLPRHVSLISGSDQILPATAENYVFVGSSQAVSPNQRLHHQTTSKDRSSVTPPAPLTSVQGVLSDVRPDLSSLKHEQQQSRVVKAMADSACDRSVQQVEARQQEPVENEPNSTMSEETKPEGKLSACEATYSDSEEPESVTGQQEDSGDPKIVTGQQEDSEEPESVIRQQDCSLSHLQPKVLLFRLPVAPSQPGCPLPSFRLVPGVAEDEIYLEEISEDSQSHAEDKPDDCEKISEPPSSPESPVTLQIVSCSACGSANGSIICLSCGRGYHRECHVPPVGPEIWSDWTCSLCQDLLDPSDSYNSDRPRSPLLSLLDQRRCESLLLYLKVEGCGRLCQSGLKLVSERLTRHRSPPYSAAAEFLSDVWRLFKTSSPQDTTLNKLQEDFHIRLVETFGSELTPSLLMPPNEDSHQQHPNDQITSESKLKETRKRLRQFLVLMGTSRAKRMKRDVIGEGRKR
ncbi:uncharacterized protein trim33l isoform X2 [Channa argus]|uniref:uncharacterized protein trim33l isoform X2 n=1 Tax=Channa argus TaxID=215402 RepID=UPI003520035C